MSTIKVSCIDQALAFENTPLITSGGLDENFVTFTFCGKWDGFEKTAVFWRNEADAYHVLLDEANTCQIPPEVTTDEGTIYFGVFGVNTENKQRTSAVLTYHIAKGVITLGTAPSDPTPDIYTQFLAEVGICKDLVQETRDAEAAFEKAMTAAQAAFENTLTKKVDDDQTAFEAAMTAAQEAYEKEITAMVAAGMVPDKSITTEKLADGAVTFEKLADEVSSGLARVATGTYTGTGTCGAGNPNSLTFEGVPMFLCVLTQHASLTEWFVLWNGGAYAPSTIDNGSNYNVFTLNGNTLSWYAAGANITSQTQCNSSEVTYTYFAVLKEE